MKTILLFLSITIAAFCNAQTKVIAHKSHSGSAQNFSKAYQKSLFDVKQSNFGIPGNMKIIVLDTVIAINDSVTILKIRDSNKCHPYFTDYRKLKKRDFETRQDTLINSKILNRNNAIEYIKANANQVTREVYFVNPIVEVVFIGFPSNAEWIEDCRPTSGSSIKKDD